MRSMHTLVKELTVYSTREQTCTSFSDLKTVTRSRTALSLAVFILVLNSKSHSTNEFTDDTNLHSLARSYSIKLVSTSAN